ncbi:hypothetical protein FVE85_1431 [Porphyridium purpureum]|uniref:Uncharacterized protein n=1 Tax=Porphyridium purpureum TaxID=35688 RepID=A0A5J4YV91_PORPP|nr:hypothetical protein FVE85_1431 [Porphyridium purpureum]|eukprot:POR4058..scf209_3
MHRPVCYKQAVRLRCAARGLRPLREKRLCDTFAAAFAVGVDTHAFTSLGAILLGSGNAVGTMHPFCLSQHQVRCPDQDAHPLLDGNVVTMLDSIVRPRGCGDKLLLMQLAVIVLLLRCLARGPGAAAFDGNFQALLQDQGLQKEVPQNNMQEQEGAKLKALEEQIQLQEKHMEREKLAPLSKTEGLGMDKTASHVGTRPKWDPNDHGKSQLVGLVKHRFAQLQLLESEKEKAQESLDSALRALELSQRRLRAFEDSRESEADQKKRAEQRAQMVKSELPQVEEQLQVLREEMERLYGESELLQATYKKLVSEYHELVGELREHPALERWLERRVGRLNPVLRAALRKSSSALVDPFVSSVKSAARMNSKLADEVQQRMNVMWGDGRSAARGNKVDVNDVGGRVSIHDTNAGDELVKGIWFYVILLFPLLMLLSFARHLIGRVRRLKLPHFILLCSAYLSLTSMVCLVASVSMNGDVVSELQKRYPALCSHGASWYLFAFLSLLGMIIRTMVQVRDPQHVSQLVASLCVFAHFYVHLWKPVIMDESVMFGKWTWMLYLVVFTLIAVERGESVLRGVLQLPISAPLDRGENLKSA